MKRPARTIRRESALRYHGRQLILTVPPTCDTLLIREKGRHTNFEVSIIDVFVMAAKRAAQKRLAERAARRS